MKTFKSFITEHKILLSNEPDMLDTHMKYHAAGIPLPDRNDLYRSYDKGQVRYPKSNGGYIEHNTHDQSIGHYTSKGLHHNEEGPAIVTPWATTWALNGRSVGEYRKFEYNDGSLIHSYYMHKHHKDSAGGWSSHEANTLGEFNKHLAAHGLPPHKVEGES